MPTLFSRIVSGEIPCHKIAENEKFLAFLDISPLREGHTLVIPKKEVNYIFDLDDSLLTEILLFCQPIAKKIEKVIPCKRIGVSVIGLEVPHAHIHLVPIDSADDLNFTRPKLQLSQERLQEIAEKIRKA
jgi:histidine triad (HIT) family protein